MSESRYEKGLKVLRSIDGSSREQGVLKEVESFCPELAKLTVEFAIGDIYSREGLDKKTRELITISSLVTSKQHNHLKDHLLAAKNLGVNAQEIKELILQLAVYAGFPAAINGMLVAKEVFSEN